MSDRYSTSRDSNETSVPAQISPEIPYFGEVNLVKDIPSAREEARRIISIHKKALSTTESYIKKFRVGGTDFEIWSKHETSRRLMEQSKREAKSSLKVSIQFIKECEHLFSEIDKDTVALQDIMATQQTWIIIRYLHLYTYSSLWVPGGQRLNKRACAALAFHNFHEFDKRDAVLAMKPHDIQPDIFGNLYAPLKEQFDDQIEHHLNSDGKGDAKLLLEIYYNSHLFKYQIRDLFEGEEDSKAGQ